MASKTPTLRMKKRITSAYAIFARPGPRGEPEFLIMRRSNDSKSNPGKWQCAGGKTDGNESILQTLHREGGTEETKIAFDPLQAQRVHIVKYFRESGVINERHSFLVEVEKGVEPILSSEHQDSEWTTLANVHKYDLVPHLYDALYNARRAYLDRRRFMQMALEQAARSISAGKPHSFYTGAVLVPQDGQPALGYKGERDNRAHAEEAAIRKAGQAANGATLYTLLEPCTVREPEHGKHPCAKQIVDAGIRRVIVAVLDKNPKIKGTGIDYLRRNGVDAHVMLPSSTHAREAERLNRNFFRAKIAAQKTRRT